jgi:hypothetical protein
MACARPNQDRYIVMSLPTASRKAVHFARWSFAGDATAYPIVYLNPHSGWFFPFLQSALHWLPTHSKLKSSPAQPTCLGLATVDATNSP